MPNTKHLAFVQRKSVQAWNKWRQKKVGYHFDLSDADFRSKDFTDFDFSWGNLEGVNFEGANLCGVDFSFSSLSKVNLKDANLASTKFFKANLKGANLAGANLQTASLDTTDLQDADLSRSFINNANFTEVLLRGTSFHNAAMEAVTLAGVDLSESKGLSTVEHLGPSFLDIQSLYRSKGVIPVAFLRGVGGSEDLVQYVRSLITKDEISCSSCFISHSARDSRFCDRLYEDLTSRGARAWYFPQTAEWGESVWGEIDRNIKGHDKLIVVCSKNSLESGPVLRELERALQMEDERRVNIVFPVRLDNYVFDQWQHERRADLVSKVVGDFSGWEDQSDKYELGFARLLDALNSSNGPSR